MFRYNYYNTSIQTTASEESFTRTTLDVSGTGHQDWLPGHKIKSLSQFKENLRYIIHTSDRKSLSVNMTPAQENNNLYQFLPGL